MGMKIKAWLPILGLMISHISSLLNCVFLFLPCISDCTAARSAGSEKYTTPTPKKSTALCQMNSLNLFALQLFDHSIRHKRKHYPFWQPAASLHAQRSSGKAGLASC